MTPDLPIYVGGGCVRVSPAASVRSALGAFLEPPTTTTRFDFALTVAPLPAPPHCDLVFHERHDLVFRLAPSRRSAIAHTNNSEGAFMAALELALQVALLDSGALLIHAAGGVVEGCGWLLPGPSGTGKSTAAREAGFDTVLSDERVVVRVDGARSTLCGTPFWSTGRTAPLNASGAPLAVLGHLEHASAFTSSPWGMDEALTYLMESVALYETGAAAVRAFDLATQVVMGSRCLRVGFARTGTWPLHGSRAA